MLDSPRRYPAHFRADARRAQRRKSLREQLKLKCERCGRELVQARRSTRKFCSDVCRVLTVRERKAAAACPVARLMVDGDRQKAERTIRLRHYSRSTPSGKSYYVSFGTALVVWSLPANYYAARHFLPGVEAPIVFELTRLYAPDGHERNLLTQAISAAVAILKAQEPDVDLVISYADPSAGHSGFVYRAASWLPVGRSEEGRAWRHKDGGPILPRRAFHSGDKHMNKPEIEGLGYVQLKLPGKHKFLRPLSRRAKKIWKAAT